MKREIREQLLAYHMGWLNRFEMEAVERLLKADPGLMRYSEMLLQSIAPLEDWNVLPVAEDLEAQILCRLVHHDAAHPSIDASANTDQNWEGVKLDPVAPSQRVLRIPFSLRDVVVTAACLGLFWAILVPSFATASAHARQQQCADNLSDLSRAVLAYGQDHQGQFPFAGTAPNSKVGDSGSAVSDVESSGDWRSGRFLDIRSFQNSRHRFLLASGQYVTDYASFVCPADEAAMIMTADSVLSQGDFPRPRNCSYDSQMLLSGLSQKYAHPELVIYSDSSPLYDRHSGRSLSADASKANSLLHAHISGQNVMRLDGTVSWTDSPNVGVHNDNIWQIAGTDDTSRAQAQHTASDSFLIP